jgi:hypothetical protein
MTPYLTIERVEFVVTYRCNSTCIHCQVDEKQRRSKPAALDPGLAARMIREVCRAWSPRSVMTFGGEPLLYADAVYAVHSAARECGIPHRQVITNAGYPSAPERFKIVAHSLAESGVNSVYISVDAFHQEFVPLEIVERNARLLLEAGIPELHWNPCWVTSPEADNPWNRRTRQVLAALAHLPITQDEGNVLMPMGRACQQLAEYLPPRQSLPGGRCGELPYTSRPETVTSLSVEPNGDITACNVLVNIAQPDLLGALQAYDPYKDRALKAVLEDGMEGLLRLARSIGVEPDPRGYYSICEMCTGLRKRIAEKMDH